MRVAAGTEGAIGAARQDDVLVVTLAGTVTSSVYQSALSRASIEADVRPFGTLVIDLTRADPRGEWDGGADASGEFCQAHHLRCALVVPTWMLLQARSECFRQMAASGLIWVAFLRLHDALEWAASWSVVPAESALPPQFQYEHPSPRTLH